MRRTVYNAYFHILHVNISPIFPCKIHALPLIKSLENYKYWFQCYLSILSRYQSQDISSIKVEISRPQFASTSTVLLIWLYSPLLGLGRFFSFLILYTAGRIPWKGDQPIARPLPEHAGEHKHTINTHRHPCLKQNSNP
jgi:hypothetical protein